MRHFIPARDELLYGKHIAQGRLVPYQLGQPCLHWAAAIESADDERRLLAFFTDQSASESPVPAEAPGPDRR